MCMYKKEFPFDLWHLGGGDELFLNFLSVHKYKRFFVSKFSIWLCKWQWYLHFGEAVSSDEVTALAWLTTSLQLIHTQLHSTMSPTLQCFLWCQSKLHFTWLLSTNDIACMTCIQKYWLFTMGLVWMYTECVEGLYFSALYYLLNMLWPTLFIRRFIGNTLLDQLLCVTCG